MQVKVISDSDILQILSVLSRDRAASWLDSWSVRVYDRDLLLERLNDVAFDEELKAEPEPTPEWAREQDHGRGRQHHEQEHRQGRQPAAEVASSDNARDGVARTRVQKYFLRRKAEAQQKAQARRKARQNVRRK